MNENKQLCTSSESFPPPLHPRLKPFLFCGIATSAVRVSYLVSLLPYHILLHLIEKALKNRKQRTLMSTDNLSLAFPPHASIRAGVVPATNLSSVVGHADTMSLMAGTLGKMFSRPAGAAESAPSQLRLAWKRPTAAACAAATAVRRCFFLGRGTLGVE